MRMRAHHWFELAVESTSSHHVNRLLRLISQFKQAELDVYVNMALVQFITYQKTLLIISNQDNKKSA